jgi:hypothetical protein
MLLTHASDRTDGYLKSDVEEVLGNYLQKHQSELSNDSTFAPYYDTIAARSPSKSIAMREDTGQKRPRRRTGRFVPGTSTFENAATYISPFFSHAFTG